MRRTTAIIAGFYAALLTTIAILSWVIHRMRHDAACLPVIRIPEGIRRRASDAAGKTTEGARSVAQRAKEAVTTPS